MDRRTFLSRAGALFVATQFVGCTDPVGTRQRLRSGTSGWFRDWSPDVVVAADDDNHTAQAKIDANPGGIVGFASGTHLERRVTPQGPGQRLIGRSDGSTRFDGSRALNPDGWTGRRPWRMPVHGNLARRRVRIDRSDHWGTVAAQLPEDLWVKSGSEEIPPYVGAGGWRRIERVANAAEVTTGTWHLDYPTGIISLGDDPAGFDEVRISVTDLAVVGQRFPVLLADLWIDKYATWSRDSPLGKQPMHRDRWQYHYVTVSGSHALGLGVSPGTAIRNCLSRHNGRFGVAGNDWAGGLPRAGTHFDIQDSRFTRNLLVDYRGGHGGGGSKFGVQSPDSSPSLVVNCWFDHNNHHGIWLDGNWHTRGVARAEIRSNLVEHNASRGLHYEVSHLARCLVRWNRFFRNGVGDMPGNVYDPSPSREGLAVSSSANLEFVENVVEDNARGIRLHDGFPGRKVRLDNITIIGNEIGTRAGGRAGRLQWWSFDAAQNRGYRLSSCGADRNRYHIDTAASDDFVYERTEDVTDFAGWQRVRSGPGRTGALDPNGSITTGPVGRPDNFVAFTERYYGAGSGLDA